MGLFTKRKQWSAHICRIYILQKNPSAVFGLSVFELIQCWRLRVSLPRLIPNEESNCRVSICMPSESSRIRRTLGQSVQNQHLQASREQILRGDIASFLEEEKTHVLFFAIHRSFLVVRLQLLRLYQFPLIKLFF